MDDNQRRARAERNTKESQVSVEINIDGTGVADVQSGCGFLDHMLDALAKHGLFDLTVRASGDYHIDEHHTVEDTAIVLGRAFNQALGDKRGINRMGDATVPLDEALAQVVVDIGGRGYSDIRAKFSNPKVGDLSTDLIWHFLDSFAKEARLNLHVRLLRGRNDHHRAEAIFKALARALYQAVTIDPRRADSLPSTKGSIDKLLLP